MAALDKSKAAAAAVANFQKSYFDVLGLCCSSEVPLVENILKSLDGIKEFSVVVPTRTVIVVHDSLLLSQIQIVKALNQARLEANVRVHGDTKHQKKWPSPSAVASGVLLLISLFSYVYHPLRWVALGAVAAGIVPIFLKAVASLRNLRVDTNVLVLITVGGTIYMKDYLEAGTVVFLFTIAQWLESRASHKANAVMSSLMSIAPQKAVIAETGEEVDVDEVKLNTVLAVKAGEVIPIDGVVVEGNCEVDEKTLTGESFPVHKQVDSTVWAGTINLNGYVSVRTTAIAEDCVVAKMAKLVEEAQNSKSKTQRFIDKCAQYYTPAVIILSAGIAILPFALRLHNHNYWFHLALVVLVSACPCALILSTPVATFCALSKAATSGLLIKGGEYLETLAKIKAVAFDKTGTITRGEFVVTDFHSLCDDINLEALVYWVSSIESKSSHPMAAALVDYGRSLSIEPKPENVEDYQNFPGEGIHGRIDGRDIYIGNKRIAHRAGAETVPTRERNTNGGKTEGYIYCGKDLAGTFSLFDACRTGAAEAIRELTSLGITTAMLTGDSEGTAVYAQEQLDHALGAVHAELLPEDKARIIKELKELGPTAMIGDGLNDAPALAMADIGISMGISGSALATETGHVILMSNDLRKVPKAIQLARKAHRKVIENVIMSLTTKAAILALAFAGHPLVWAAVLADVGTCLLVIFNSMLLLRGTHAHAGKCCKSSGASHTHKHGHENSSHNHKHCCSAQEVEKICESKSSSCASGCKSSHISVSSCRKRTRISESICSGVRVTKPCSHVSCNPVNPDVEANIPHNNGCSASDIVNSCTSHKCGTPAEKQGSSCTVEDMQEEENHRNLHCLTATPHAHHHLQCNDGHHHDHHGHHHDHHDHHQDDHHDHHDHHHDHDHQHDDHQHDDHHDHQHDLHDHHHDHHDHNDHHHDHHDHNDHHHDHHDHNDHDHQNHKHTHQSSLNDNHLNHDDQDHQNHNHNHQGHDHQDHCHATSHHSKDICHSEDVQKMTSSGNCRASCSGQVLAETRRNDDSAARIVQIPSETIKCCKDLSNQPRAAAHACLSLKKRETESCCKSSVVSSQTSNCCKGRPIPASTLHACMSLEKREIASCCQSYIKECCSKHGHLATGFGGGLSEIIIEQV